MFLWSLTNTHESFGAPKDTVKELIPAPFLTLPDFPACFFYSNRTNPCLCTWCKYPPLLHLLHCNVHSLLRKIKSGTVIRLSCIELYFFTQNPEKNHVSLVTTETYMYNDNNNMHIEQAVQFFATKQKMTCQERTFYNLY